MTTTIDGDGVSYDDEIQIRKFDVGQIKAFFTAAFYDVSPTSFRNLCGGILGVLPGPEMMPARTEGEEFMMRRFADFLRVMSDSIGEEVTVSQCARRKAEEKGSSVA